MTDRKTARFLADVAKALGDEWVDSDESTITEFGRSELPSGDRPPRAVLYPGNTADVQTVVQLANRHGVPLHPISTGRNIGLGSAVAAQAGNVIVHLGRRMNRILHFDDVLNYVVVEPGVTYDQLNAFLVEQGDRLMCDTTSGPPDGGPLGNTLDKGAGYTMAADHFGNSCGLEVVLGDGRILRTGDGAVPRAHTWHLSKYGLGPVLDGLFLQSNYGVVTRMGIWLQARPKVIQSFFFIFPDDDDIEEITEVARDLRLSGIVPTAIKATGDLYALSSQIPYPADAPPLSDDLRKDLHRQHDIGSWIVSGALYGAAEPSIAPALETVRARFTESGRARYIPHTEAIERPELKIHLDTYSGRPTAEETKMVQWRGGGIVSLTPATPLIGTVAKQHMRTSRRILSAHGLDTCIDYIFAGRSSRGLHSILFDSRDPEERGRVADAARAIRREYVRLGYPVGRVPADAQADEMEQRDDVFRTVIRELKSVLDPNGILSPGRYGIVPPDPSH